MGQAAENLERGTQAWRHFPAETRTNVVDHIGRQVGEIAQRLVLDLVALAVGTTKEHCAILFALIAPNRRGYMDCAASFRHGLELQVSSWRKSSGFLQF